MNIPIKNVKYSRFRSLLDFMISSGIHYSKAGLAINGDILFCIKFASLNNHL
jgi:hypothetical protein